MRYQNNLSTDKVPYAPLSHSRTVSAPSRKAALTVMNGMGHTYRPRMQDILAIAAVGMSSAHVISTEMVTLSLTQVDRARIGGDLLIPLTCKLRNNNHNPQRQAAALENLRVTPRYGATEEDFEDFNVVARSNMNASTAFNKDEARRLVAERRQKFNTGT